MRKETVIQAEGGVNRRWRKEVQGIPVMNAGMTYTVKHIQKGLTLWANKKSNANGMPLCLFCSIWSKRIERIARYDKENLLW